MFPHWYLKHKGSKLTHPYFYAEQLNRCIQHVASYMYSHLVQPTNARSADTRLEL